MNKDQSAYFAMVSRVINHCQEKKAVWQSSPIITKTISKLISASEGGLALLKAKEAISTEGYTAAKDQKFAEMKDAGFILAKRLTSYARDNEMWVLLSQVHYSESAFGAGAENEVLNRCMIVADLGEENISAGADYKITADVVANLRKLIGEYKGMPEQRDNVRSEKKVTGQDVKGDIKKIHAILDDLDDKVIGLIDDKNFRDLYFEARVIQGPGSRGSNGKTDTPTK